MVITRIIIEGNNLVFRSATNDIVKIMPCNGLYANEHCKDNYITIGTSPQVGSVGRDELNIDVTNITLPAGPWTKQTLLEELNTNYFNCGSGGGGGGSDTTAVNQVITNNLLQGIGGTQRTPSYNRFTTAGNVALGKYKVSIFNIGGADGSVLGTVLKPNEAVSFSVRDSDTLSLIGYDATGTEFSITTIE